MDGCRSMHYVSDKRDKGAGTHLLREGLCSVGSQKMRPVYPTLRKEHEGWGRYRGKDRCFTRGNRMGHSRKTALGYGTYSVLYQTNDNMSGYLAAASISPQTCPN
jgi:hypothetical protein